MCPLFLVGLITRVYLSLFICQLVLQTSITYKFRIAVVYVDRLTFPLDGIESVPNVCLFPNVCLSFLTCRTRFPWQLDPLAHV
jgi:hypothetical protein